MSILDFIGTRVRTHADLDIPITGMATGQGRCKKVTCGILCIMAMDMDLCISSTGVQSTEME